MNNLKIAIQKKGHLKEESLLFLKSLGINCPEQEKQLISRCPKTKIKIIFLRDDDIPNYIENNLIDFGIIGEDIIQENNNNAKVIKKLGFSKCRLVLASPQDSKIKNIKNLQNKTVATSYPNILKNILDKNNINSRIIKVSGSVEVAPTLGLADAICDLTQTGGTLKQFNLQEFFNVLNSEAVLISNSIDNQRKNKFIQLINQYADS